MKGSKSSSSGDATERFRRGRIGNANRRRKARMGAQTPPDDYRIMQMARPMN
jgi:hypothetical protein